MLTSWRSLASLLLTVALAPGLAHGQAQLGAPVIAKQQPPADHVEVMPTPSKAEPQVTLDQLLALVARHPEVAAAQARADVARGKLIQAGLYLNPIVTPRINELGNKVNSLGEPGLTLQQEVVTGHKLQLAQAAAAQGVAAADWQAITKWQDVMTRVRLAHVEFLTARREVQTTEEIVNLTRSGLEVARKLQKAGAGSEPDVLRALVELEQSQIRRGVAQQRLEAARRLLAAAVGVEELPPGEVAGDLEASPPIYEWNSLLAAVLSQSSEVQEALALSHQAEAAWRRARAEPMPNLLMMVRPGYHFPNQETRVLVEVGAQLPLFNRNQGNIAAALADLSRTRLDVQQVELKLRERLALAYQRYQSARQQVESYQKHLLPNARESLRLVQLGYQRGEAKFDFTAVLQSQVTLIQSQLTYVQALGDLWRAVSEINGLLQLDRR